MKKRRLLSFFLILLLIAAQTPPAFAADGFDVEAKAALLIEADTGEVLFEKNAHEKNYPASITKVMTALLVFEEIEAGRLSFSTPVTVSETATALPGDASTVGLKPGEVLTVEQLLYCLLVPSANEAANALAEAAGGSVASFVARMNERARELGCESTHFANPHGLHDERHYSSAWDIYLIASEALKHDGFLDICNTRSYGIAATELSDTRTLYSTNYLISPYRTRSYLYDGAQGIKTGYTPEAGYCLVSSAVRGSRRLISVVLGTERVVEDGIIWTKSFVETIRLFDHGFDDFERRDILSATEAICEVPVELSSETNYVVAHPAEDITRMMPIDVTADLLERTVTLDAESFEAPIAAGDVLGTLTLSYGGVTYGETALLALSDVSASWILTAQRDVVAFLSQTWVKAAAIGAAALVLGLVVLRASLRARRYGSRRGRAYSNGGYRGRRKR